MKLVTQDYGCGTSSSILDYKIKDVVIVSEANYQHVFEEEDDLLFIGHDFLFFLWDTEEKLKRWMSRKDKWEHWVWCFERIDAIVPQWQQKSHRSLSLASQFCKRILACDEDDCDKYGFDWLPQWASCRFYNERTRAPESDKILFSGQAGKPEYQMRNALLNEIVKEPEISERLVMTNTSRSMSWDEYVNNLMQFNIVLNPVGILRGLNTRAYETLYSGRILLQHSIGKYERHEELLRENPGVLFFKDFDELRFKLRKIDTIKTDSDLSFTQESIYARMRSIGISIK
jgi:hypothetical protein